MDGVGQRREANVDSTVQAVIVAAVRQNKGRTSLLWADQLADRIADSTPLQLNRSEIGNRLTQEAVRQGIPVVVGSNRAGGQALEAA